MSRRATRGEPSPLVQIPVWGGDAPLEAGRGRGARRRRGAARRAQPRAAPRGDPRRRAAAGGRRRRDRQDAGHHPADRVADRDPARQAVGDPGPHVHRPGRGRDAGPGRPARAVRLHGHGDLDVPRVRRPADPRVRPGARPAAGRAGAVAARDRRLPARAAVRARARRVPAAGRPDAVPRRARDAVLAGQGRGRVARRVPRLCGPAGGTRRRRARPWPRTARTRIPTRPPRSRRTRAARRSSPAPTGATRRCSPQNGSIDFGDQVSLALRLLRDSPAAREAVQRRFKYILVDEFQDTNRAQAELVALVAERHRNVTVVGDDDQSIYKFRGAAISNILEFRERYRQARVVVLRRNYRSRAPILDASYRLVRHNEPDRLESRGGHRQAPRSAARRRRRRARPPRGVRERRRGGGLDRRGRRAPDPRGRAAARRRRAGPRERRGRSDPARAEPRGNPVAVLRARAASTRARRSACSCRSCARSPTSPRRSTSTRWRRPTCTGSGATDLVAIVNTARRRNRSVWDVLEELDRQPGILRLSPETRAAAIGPRRGPQAVRGARQRAAGGRGAVRVPAGTGLAGEARRRRVRRPPRRRCPTSRGSSTSSAPSRRCSPTTGRCSSRAT